MWVLLEGKVRAIEVDTDQKNYMTRSFNLDRLIPILREIFKDLKNIKPEETEFFTFNDRINLIPPGTSLNSLFEITTNIALLVVRYLLSTSTISHIPVGYGILSAMLQNQKNEFQFNEMISKIKPNCEDECEVSISIQVTGRKAFSNWKIGEALNEFLYQKGSTIFDIRSFSIDELLRPNPPIPEKAIANLLLNLKKGRVHLVLSIETNQLVKTVTHIQEEAKRLLLKVEELIDGTKAYRPIDYSIFIEEVLVLVQKVKKDNFEKGTAQNITQIHSTVESRKQRIKIDLGDEEVPVVMYRIITNALQ
ncbi:1577_t:CDS:2, partial [Gigaspora margarita]